MNIVAFLIVATIANLFIATAWSSRGYVNIIIKMAFVILTAWGAFEFIGILYPAMVAIPAKM